MEQNMQRVVLRVSWTTILINFILSAFKLIAGVAARSGAMISDGVHSASDVLSTFVVMLGVRLAGRASDKDHPYGHERLECVAALILAGILFFTGAGIAIASGARLFSRAAIPTPGGLALAAAAISVAVKEAMYHYTCAAAKRVCSGALMADAWHHRSDALSSVGSFAGILGARLGVPALDPVAGAVISLLIVKAAYEIFRDSVAKMTDRGCDDETVEAIRRAAARQDGVLGIDQIRTRRFGNRIYVDMEIRADGSATLTAAHEAAQRTHDAVEALMPEVKHCMVHVNPAARER